MSSEPVLLGPPAAASPLRVDFRFGDRSMPIVIGDDVRDACADFCVEEGIDRLFFVADANVWTLYGDDLAPRYGARLPVAHVAIDAREAAKNLSTVERVLDAIVAGGATRRSCVAALGGGLTGNVAGVLAGLLYRGIRLLHLPTTLLAMSDSILSMKQAVNGRTGKNLFGLFHLPVASFVSLQFLATLPRLERVAGINELIKNCLVFDPGRTASLLSLVRRSEDPDCWSSLVLAGIDAKQKLLADDATERQLGLSLEYGHTVGHALELQPYGLTHGVAVALGMCVAAVIARNRGMLGDDAVQLHVELLRAVDPWLAFPENVDVEATIELVRHDNKHGYLQGPKDAHPFVLLSAIGRPAMTEDRPLVLVREDEIRGAIEIARRDLMRRAR